MSVFFFGHFLILYRYSIDTDIDIGYNIDYNIDIDIDGLSAKAHSYQFWPRLNNIDYNRDYNIDRL